VELFFVIAMSKDGYQSALQVAIPNSLTSVLMFTEEEIAAAAQAVEATYPAADTGLLAFLAVDARGISVSGYSVSVVPPFGLGPSYFDRNNNIDTTLTSSSASGGGAVFEMPPGSYTLDFSHASLNCGDLFLISVVSGYITNVLTSCL